MPTLLLTIFLLQLTIHLVNTIGASTINDLLWTLYTSLSTPFSSSPSKDATIQASLRREVVRLKREMAATSAQDNFARWAKLRREHDRALQRHDEMAAANSSTRSKFDTYASATRWGATNGLRLFLQVWYARTAVFRLPGGGGWVPGWVGWVVGFPGVRRGEVQTNGSGSVVGHGGGSGSGVGVSVQVWGWVCVVVIGLVVEGMAEGVERLVGMTGRRGREKSEGMGMGMKMDSKMRAGAGPTEAEAKKSR